MIGFEDERMALRGMEMRLPSTQPPGFHMMNLYQK